MHNSSNSEHIDEALASCKEDPARLLAGEISGIAEPTDPLPPLDLEGLPRALKEAASKAGWRSLMPVQASALPYLLQGRDLMVQSRTGSGKTGAFLLPALARLDPRRAACQALILTPTRELALQVEADAKTLFADSGLNVVAAYGGVGYGRQLEGLRQGAHLVVGTPGRLLDHLLRRSLSLDNLRMLVFDEADRMLSIGFYPDMKEIQRYLPKSGASVHFFSATFPGHVLRLASEFMPRPELLSLSSKEVHISQMEHIFYATRPMEKDRMLIRVLEMESPSAAIIFCNTKANVHYVAALLRGFGYNADELSADLSQTRREEVLFKMRRGELRFLVATDVAARGLDIPELSHVVLYEPPEDQESYIHRAGRTARAGAGGTVISLVDIMQKIDLARIAKHYKIDLKERPAPAEEDLSGVVGERLTSLLEARLRKLTSLQRERLKRFTPLVASLAADEDSAMLLNMLLDSAYQESLHSLPVPQGAQPAAPASTEHTPRRRGGSKNRRRSGQGGSESGQAKGAPHD